MKQNKSKEVEQNTITKGQEYSATLDTIMNKTIIAVTLGQFAGHVSYFFIRYGLQFVTVQYQFNPGTFTLFEDGSFILFKIIVGCLPWGICS